MDQSVFSFSKKYNYLSILFRRGRKFIEGVGGGGGGATHDYQGNLATMIPQSVFLRKMSFHVFILLLFGNI